MNLLAIYVICCQAQEILATVTTQEGKVEGKILLSRNGRKYFAFLQLPYAKAQRFQAPTPPDKFDGVLKATEYGADCAQSFWYSNELSGVEDCLYLHIYTPKLRGKLPVLVNFHGGGFTVGTASGFHANYFMDEDLVLVMVKYRLGPFGFLSTGDEIIPGNYGLKDQQQALKWIQANVESFGGDPNSITIFGSSAGASSVNYHMLSEMSRGLFHAGISQSGTALNPWAFSPFPAKMAKKYGGALSCPTNSSQDLLNCLLKKSAKELQEGMKATVEWGCDPFTPFGPVIEPNIPGSFLNADPVELLRAGNFTKTPWMAGLVQDEGIHLHSAYVLAHPELSLDLQENWKRIFPITLQYNWVYHNFSSEAQTKMAEQLQQFYFRNKPISNKTRVELTDAYSDRLFNHGVKTALLLAAPHTQVYPYLFTHNREDYSLIKVFGIEGNFGVGHADEVTFLFNNVFGQAPEFKVGSTSERVSKNLVKLWVSFARDKKPTALWGSQKTWEPLNTSDSGILHFYKLDVDTEIIPEHFTQRLEFWDEILHEASIYQKQL